MILLYGTAIEERIFLLQRSNLCITPRFIWGMHIKSDMNSVGVLQLIFLVNPDGVALSFVLHPPDKSGGYAQ